MQFDFNTIFQIISLLGTAIVIYVGVSVKSAVAESKLEFEAKIGEIKTEIGNLKGDIGFLKGKLDNIK